MTTLPAHTLMDQIWPADTNGSSKTMWRRLALVAGGSMALALSAKIKLHVGPVPVSMQTFVLLSLAMAYGARMAGATVLAYLAQGAAGLPVFAGTPEKGIGIAYMMGPTGGYLLGFLLAAVAVGALAQRGWDRTFFSTTAALLLGNALIYIPGLLWLGMMIGWDKPVLAFGLYPFLAGDLIKIALAVTLFPTLWTLLKGRKG